ncbi:hypothetical protein ACHAWO_005193 [Cyclotella atomus]|uniref:Solute carrier family 40 protein n=1 Tax=Cyclotella atomus TaxID=382360 RepID=A0ABD3MXS1_9STRA
MRSHIIQSLSATAIVASAASHSDVGQRVHVRSWASSPPHHSALTVRGGATDAIKKKSKSSKKSSTEAVKDEAAKDVINEKMKESDAATLMGNAIRDQAEVLLKDKLPYPERTFDAALVSLGLSLGTAGTDKDNGAPPSTDDERNNIVETPYYAYTHRYPRMSNQQYVQPSTSAVIANYFLKTHGGTHAIQCILSLLASVLGVACLLLPSFPIAGANVQKVDVQALSMRITLASTKCSLLQQTLLLAVAKHASGLIGAIMLGASKIPQLGLRDTRKYLETVTSDPVGQYLFYCSLLVVWLNWGTSQYVAAMKKLVISTRNSAAVGAGTSDTTIDPAVELLNGISQNPPPWYLSQSTGGSLIPTIILLPILLREIISIAWVISDVLTLAFTSSGGLTGKFMHGLLISARSILDAVMSILVTSDKWRKADSFTRQRTLARLVSQASVGMEVLVGGVLIGDAVQCFWRVAFVRNTSDVSFKTVLGKLVCAHLYLNFLLSRRKKIQVLVGSIRGGALLDRVLDVLIDPKREMGLAEDDEENED